MKNFFSLIVILLIITTCGCSKDKIDVNNVYTGHSSKWKVEYKVTGFQTFYSNKKVIEYSSDIYKNLTLVYNGNIKDLSSIKNATVSLKALGSVVTKTLDFSSLLTRNTYKMDLGEKKGSYPVETKSDIIKINIILDRNIETIELKCSK